MSDGPSIRNHQITKPYFRTCSARQPRSQAPLCLCALRAITDRAEGTFGFLRYLLGGDRPSQTTHLVLSLARIHGSGLEPSQYKGGISRLAPPELASELQSLPPILHMHNQNPMLSCSKGSRGLSVLLWLAGIFTDITISLSFWSRQWGSRYTIRAGRNLPDKEFRYLRTVIVTAAVYWGFNTELLPTNRNDKVS